MGRMSEQRAQEFITERLRTAKVATVQADGRPHVAAVWIDLDEDGTVVFRVMTGEDIVKGEAIRRDPLRQPVRRRRSSSLCVCRHRREGEGRPGPRAAPAMVDAHFPSLRGCRSGRGARSAERCPR